MFPVFMYIAFCKVAVLFVVVWTCPVESQCMEPRHTLRPDRSHVMRHNEKSLAAGYRVR